MGDKKKDTAPFHRMRWLAVVGGFLDGARIEFGPGESMPDGRPS